MSKQMWYAVEFSNAIGKTPQSLKILGQDLVLYRTSDGRIHAMNNTCIHRGASLAQGKIAQDCIVCPYHGWHYQPDGTCTKIPSQSTTIAIPQIQPNPAIFFLGWISRHFGCFGNSNGGGLGGDFTTGAIGLIVPTMIGTDDTVLGDLALGK